MCTRTIVSKWSRCTTAAHAPSNGRRDPKGREGRRATTKDREGRSEGRRVAGQSEGRRVAEGRRHLHSCTHSTVPTPLCPVRPPRPPCHHGRSELRSELPTSTGLSSPTARGTRAVWLSGVRGRGGAQFDRSGEGQRISTTHRASSAGMATAGSSARRRVMRRRVR